MSDNGTAVIDGPALDRIQHPRQRALLAVYAQTGNIVRSARAAKVDRTTHYFWLDSDPDYARAFEEARRQSIDILESEAMRRAVEGTETYVIHHGQFVKDPETGKPLVVRHFSDKLLCKLLEAGAPHRYRSGQAPVVDDDDGARIAGRGREVVIQEEIAARQAVLEHLKSGGNGKAN